MAGDQPPSPVIPFLFQAPGRLNRVHDTGKPSERYQDPSPRSEHLEDLKIVAAEVRQKKKVPRDKMINTILEVCSHKFLSLPELANVLNRSRDTLRVHYLAKLMAEGRLDLEHPERLNHPRQRYITRRDVE